MFIQQIFEAAARRVIVTYPGRFQPFHKGHAEVFANLQRKYGGDNVFIVTSNKTDSAKSPFSFSDKVQFMHAMGVPNHNIVQADQVYDLPAAFNNIKDQVVFITVIGAPDEKRLQPGRIKKDGTPGYFQPLPSSAAEFQTADKHGYVIIEPEHPKSITVGGKTYDVSHGTPTRDLWNQVRNDPKQRQEFIQGLYGVNDPELGKVLDKIPTGAAPAPEPAKKMKNVKKDLKKVQHDPNAEQPVAEAGYGRNRGYNYGFASPTAPSLGRRGREDDEYHVPDPVDTSIWYIRCNGKIIKDKMGTPFQFRNKEAARKSALTMMQKPFNAGKKFMLTTKPEDEAPAPVAESAGPVTHRIGVTVIDPNHPMVSKRKEAIQKSIRITQTSKIDRDAAINQAIAHYRRKGYKVLDHHYMGTVDPAVAEGNKGISKDAETKFHAKLDTLVHDTFGKRKSEKNMAEGAELKQAKRKYNQAAKDANTDQVGAGKKIDTMKKSLRQKDLDNKKEIDEGATGAKPGWMLKQDPALAKKVKDSKAGYQALKKWAGKPVPKDDKQDIKEFAPDDGGGSRKFIPWTEFIEQVKQIVGKDFSVKENIVKSTIKARFVPHDPMEFGPTMLYSYYETRAGGRNKGAISTRGSIQVGKYTKGGLFGQSPDQLLTGFHLLKGHPFERHFDLTFDNIYKIANIIQGNTDGALEFQPQQQGVAEGAGNIGSAIKSLYQKIHSAGDDEVEYFYHDSPIFAQYWDEYEGDLDSIIAEVDPAELQVMLDELESYVQQANLAEGGTKLPSGDYINQHTGVRSSKPPVKKKRGEKTGAEWDAIEKAKKDKEQGVAETSNQLVPHKENPMDLSSDYAYYIVSKGNSLLNTFKKLFARANTLPPDQRDAFYNNLANTAANGHLGDTILAYSKTLSLKDLLAISDVFDEYGEMFHGIAFPDDFADYEAAWKQYASDVILARTHREPGQTMHEQGVAEGGIAVVGWPDEGNHTGNNPPVSVGGTFPARPVVKKGSLVKAIGISGVHRVMDIRGDEAYIVQEIPNSGGSNYVPMSDLRVWTNKPIAEFAPPGDDGSGDDGFDDETLKRMAAQWWQGDEDPRIEQTLAAAGWEIGRDEGYDNGGVFVVMAGDEHGKSYMSWPAEELEGLSEGGIGLDHKRNRFKSLRTMGENAEELNIGDPVIITGDVQFRGKTGDIDSFGANNRFVIVNLYNHGKHSFHSSDVSYNDYADKEDDLDEDMYQYNAQDPYNSEFAPRAGMGSMTLRGWKQQMIKRTAELAQQMAAAGQEIDKAALWDNVYQKLKSMNMDPIAQEIEQAHKELENIRRRGGIRSRAFK